MKINAWIYFGLGIIALVLFIFVRNNREGNYFFLGLGIGGILKGVYEMKKAHKSKNHR